MVEGILAKSSRPGYPSVEEISRETVDLWVDEVRGMGVGSIICILAERQLVYYSNLPGGLIDYYRSSGLEVFHIPQRDHKSPPLNDENQLLVARGFEELPKPVLVHCSAGIDRTGMAVEIISELIDRN